MQTSVPESQAHNFVSAAQEGIDPRTGLYSFSFPLATLSASENQAPFLPLTLSWSPLQAANQFGLGTGFSPGMTLYDESVRPGRIILSTGEQYRVDRTLSGGGLTLRQCPLPSFRISKVTRDGRTQCLIQHKDGLTEILEEQTQNLWLPVRIVAATGRYLTLKWSANQGTAVLSAVYDENDLLLYTFTRGTVPVATIWPGTAEALTLELHYRNGYLSEIRNVSKASEPLTWKLGWDDNDAVRLPGNVCPLNEIRTPSGLKHTLTWTAKKIPFNARHGQGSLPAVTRSLVDPGVSQPVQTVLYRYSEDTNWLGYGAAFSDSEFDTDNDNLLSLSRPYHYWTDVTLKGDEHIPDIVVRRTYNRFHLMTEEKTTQADCSHIRGVEYYADESKPLSGQKAIWSFPHVVTQTWQKGSATRSERSRTDYDEQTGNPVKQTAPDGTVTTMTYYPASGEAGKCPADPHGFERCLKSRTVTPVRSVYGDEPVSREVYTWTDIAEKAAHRQQAVVMPDTVSSFVYLSDTSPEARTPQGITTYRYQDSDAAARDFGRLKSQVTALYNAANPAHPYETETTLNFTCDTHNRLTRATTFRTRANAADPDFSAFTRMASQVTSALSGRPLSQTDAAGNTSVTEYDELGRPKTNTLHPEESNRDYRMQVSTTYSPADEVGRTQTVQTDIPGNRIRVTSDAMGRPLTLDVQDTDGPEDRRQTWLTVKETACDVRGQVQSVTTRDWLRGDGDITGTLPGLKTGITFTTTAVRDNWGQVVSVTGSDGLTYHRESDPVACTVTTWTTDTAGKDTPRTVQYYDARTGQAVRGAVFATESDQQQNKPYSIVTQEWDGAGRLRKSTDTEGHITTFTYDRFGRVTDTTLPDHTVISKAYAPFSTASLPVSIRVTDPATNVETVVGTQRFDALGRVVSTTCGKDAVTGRTTTCQYEPNPAARPNVNRVTGPDGVTCSTQSDPRLGNALLSLSAQDKNNVLPAVSQAFRYDTLTGKLKEALEGKTVTRLTYRPSGAVLQQENQVYDGSWLKTLAVGSLVGRIQQVTGIDGHTVTSRYATEGHLTGLVTGVSDGTTLAIDLKYDDLLRVKGWTATELKGKHTLTVDITPDVYGREHIRTLTHSNGEVRTQTQTWYTSGLLKTRTLSRRHNNTPQAAEETLRAESFGYDDRSRLTDYQVTGTQLPRDAYGNAFVSQRFTFDALSNIRTCKTTLDKAGSEAVITARYEYAEHDPCQLRSVTHDREAHGYRNLSFSAADYDAAGRLLKDEAGRRLHYDAAGRLVRVTQNGIQAGEYGYDAGNQLVWQRVDSTQQLHRLYYRGSRLVNEWISPQGNGEKQDDKRDTLIRLTGMAQTTRQGDREETLLLGTDEKGSVLTGNDDSTRDYTYSPYGYRSRTERGSDKQAESLRGWNGERQDPVTGSTHLGNGYRAYNPVLMRFHCPDSLSPFGAGGINPYAYCEGDPVNHADPTGHLSWRGWLSIGLGIAAVVIGVATLGLGAAGAISLGVMAASMAVLDVASGALSIASGALEEKDPEMSEKLGWASLGVGGPSMVYGGVKMIQAGVNLMKRGGLYEQAVGRLLKGMSGASGAGRATESAQAITQGAKVAVVASRDGYAPSQVAAWDRVATRGLGEGRLRGGALEVISEHPWEINDLSLRTAVTVPENVYTLGVSTSQYDILAYAFEGFAGNSKHLDILLHSGITGGVYFNDAQIGASDLLSILKREIPRFNSRYTSFSVFSCNSGGGLAQELAKLTGQQVIGYTGTLFYSPSLKLQKLMDIEGLARHMFNGQNTDVTNLFLRQELPGLTAQEREIYFTFPGGALAYFP